MLHQFSTEIDFLLTSKKKPNYSILSFKQCLILDNSSEIPSVLHPKTDNLLSNILFTEKDIEKVIQNLDSKKAHGVT